MIRRYFHKARPPAEGGRAHDNDKKKGNKAEEFPEVHDCVGTCSQSQGSQQE
jgi:hypothetical protein